MYKKKLWKSMIAGALALAIAMVPFGSREVVSAVEAEEIAEIENGEDTPTGEVSEPINSTTFPDDNFRNYVLNEIDDNEDTILSEEEISVTKTMIVAEKSIGSLQGIEYFVELENLFCDKNQLTSLDVSNNTKLVLLSCEKNQLTSLDVSNNTQLIHLNCGYNRLTSLDVNNNTQLKRLNCAYNQLTSIDVSANTQLQILGCHGNHRLTSLDVSNNTQLTGLYCYENLLTSLDVSNNTQLNYLNCSSNQLKSLDVSNNIQLIYLYGSCNQLTSLDVSNNIQLTKLYCSSNQLTSLDVSNNTQLNYLNCSSNQLESLDVSKNTELTDLCCLSNQLAYLDLSKNTKLQRLDSDYNVYIVKLNSKRQIDLTTIPGFKVSKMSNVSGGTLSGNILTFNSGVDKVTYTYDCGNGHSVAFAIKGVDAQTLTKAFCTRLYTLCLGRAADASGVNYWTEQLNGKKVTGAQVGYGFVFSDEYKKKNTSDEAYVKMLYKVFMDREADKSGLNYWLDLLNQGMSREYVYKGFAESKEFTNICASYGIERGSVKLTQARDRNVNLTKFVNRIYVKAMNRKGEEKGLNYWCSQIQSKKMTPVQVAESFIYSKEFTDKSLSNREYIKVLYRTFMGREADTAGLNYWLGRLNKGESRKTVLKAFAGCQEFKNIVKSFGL